MERDEEYIQNKVDYFIKEFKLKQSIKMWLLNEFRQMEHIGFERGLKTSLEIYGKKLS